MSTDKLMVKLLHDGGYKDWKTVPKFPVVVEAVRSLGGYTISAAEMFRIGYSHPSKRYFFEEEVEEIALIPKGFDVVEAPFSKVRTPKRRNPQAVRYISQLGDGLFRVNGLYKGKARICEVQVLADTVLFISANPTLPNKELLKSSLQGYLGSGELSIMCVERF